MFALRIARQPLLRPITRQTRTIALTSRRAAAQDYGSGEGDPIGEKAAKLGKNPSEHLEHPGPEAPSVGKNSGSGQQGGGQQQQQGGQQQQQQQQQQPTQGSSGQSKSTQGAQPKILNESPPQHSEAPKDVQEHNNAMDKRADKANAKATDEDVEKDKVGKGFWAGQGGADKDP